jgi:hypothetical protein
MSRSCNRCKELSETVDDALSKLATLTKDQLTAFRERDLASFRRIDKELELTVGHKERSIGALREHQREHGPEELIEKAS